MHGAISESTRVLYPFTPLSHAVSEDFEAMVILSFYLHFETESASCNLWGKSVLLP